MAWIVLNDLKIKLILLELNCPIKICWELNWNCIDLEMPVLVNTKMCKLNFKILGNCIQYFMWEMQKPVYSENTKWNISILVFMTYIRMYCIMVK